LTYIDSTDKSDYYRAKWKNKDVFIKTITSDASDKNDLQHRPLLKGWLKLSDK